MQVTLKDIQGYEQLIIQWASDPLLKEYFRRYPPSHIWAHCVRDVFPGSHIIVVDDEPVGLASLFNIDSISKKAEIGILVDPNKCPNRAKIAVQAMRQVVEYAFDYIGLNKLYCYILPHRDDLRLLLGLYGFKQEGELKEHLFWEGSYHDELLMGLLKKDLRD